MTRLFLVLTSCAVLLFFSAACSNTTPNPAPSSVSSPAASPAAQRITSEGVVKTEGQPVEISAGGSAEAIVLVEIQSGYHVNANPPTYPYLKATVLELPTADGVSVNAIAYPKAVNKTFAFAEKPLAVYEGETELKATLKADKAAKLGQRTLTGKLRIQACDDQVCYPPGSLDVAIPVNIK